MHLRGGREEWGDCKEKGEREEEEERGEEEEATSLLIKRRDFLPARLAIMAVKTPIGMNPLL